ncbi:hypothetical protein BZZ01_13555 [Nostocales cyanobacterium HT-58-2]|nr:hypothetical protein BZZ01_13555 [Nostocales cyanobacterium HT-58-2]
MMYANVDGEEKVLPTPKQKGHCPLCGSQVLSKCGSVVAWHWAHQNMKDCDSWAENESEWHLGWKLGIEKKYTEVGFTDSSGERHRADISFPLIGHSDDAPVEHRLTIELQHSSIPVEEIKQREAFYKHLVWVLDARDFYISKRYSLKEGLYRFRWYYPRRTFVEAQPKRLYLDRGEGKMLYVTGLSSLSTGTYFNGGELSVEKFWEVQHKNRRVLNITPRSAIKPTVKPGENLRSHFDAMFPELAARA